MGYNRFSVQIIIRVIVIFLTLVAFTYFLPKPNRIITSIFFALFAISQVIGLIRFGTKINKDFARFLIELKEKDTTELYFPESLDKNFKNLKYSFQQISDEIKKTRIEKLGQEQYLAYIIENFSDGFISFDEDGKVKIINSAAKEMLQIQFLNSIWDLDNIQTGLAKKLVLSRPGQQKLINVKIGNNVHDFLFRLSEVKIESQIIKILTFQDLKRELEEKEISSWKKLIRVLTHEMMNSLTPITTLSVAVRRILKSGDELRMLKELNEEDLNDIYKNNETIENRSKGLLNFINEYRRLTKVPELQKEEVNINEFLNCIKQLFSESVKEKQIDFKIDTSPTDLTYSFDKKLIEQVLINLIKNSIEAMENKEDKKIQLVAKGSKQSLEISVQDNGNGINNEIKEDVFIPFFTTKKDGSGIGLSLSKEIMQKHNGEIYFESEAQKGTCFYLKF
jgi:nitrogen fixation/metabolism regulation signal transduction histidine kinase